jgi:hypothetical protein
VFLIDLFWFQTVCSMQRLVSDFAVGRCFDFALYVMINNLWPISPALTSFIKKFKYLIRATFL